MKNYEEVIVGSLKRSINKLTPDIRESILNECSNIDVVKKVRKKNIAARIGYVVAISYMAFFILINTIPASAQILYKVPIINKLVWRSVIDKGIFQALDKGHSQPINESITDKDIRFTVHDLIVGNKINFLMSVKLDTEIYEGEIQSINISAKDQRGSSLSFTSGVPYYDKNSGEYIFDCNIVSFTGDAFKEINNVGLEVSSIRFNDGIELKGNWKIEVPIQTNDDITNVLWEKEMNINISNNDGISFLLEKVVSTPSDLVIYLRVDEINSRVTPRNMYIIDSDGIEIPMLNGFAQKTDGVIIYKYYFDGIHPNKPVKFVYSDGNSVKEINLE